MKHLVGVFNVISTPIDNSDEIDQNIFKQEIDWLIKCGSNGAVLAMVSEVLRFSTAERRKQKAIAVIARVFIRSHSVSCLSGC
jgi:dihydrodipicolinate synthase/N-acetylneuraminate lyase